MDAVDIPKRVTKERRDYETYKTHTIYINGTEYSEYCFATLFRRFRAHLTLHPDYLNEVFYLLDISGNWFNHAAILSDLQYLFGAYFRISMHYSGYKGYRWVKIAVYKNPPHWSLIWAGLYLMLTILREMDSKWMCDVWRLARNPAVNNPNRFTTCKDMMLQFTLKSPAYDVHDDLYALAHLDVKVRLDNWLTKYLKNLRYIWGTKRVWNANITESLERQDWNYRYQTFAYDCFLRLTKRNDEGG